MVITPTRPRAGLDVGPAELAFAWHMRQRPVSSCIPSAVQRLCALHTASSAI
jgi:hypothetical protein